MPGRDGWMGRRAALGLAGSAAALPLAPRAEASTPVVGFLNGAAAELTGHYVRAFRQGLAETGHVEGRNVAIEFRWADGRYDRLPALALDLVRRQVAVIAATSTPAGLPAKAATATIPIVFVTGSDPVQQGLVASLNRPEGNVTGVTTLAVDLGRKRMELIRAVVPGAHLVGVLVNPTGPNLGVVLPDLEGAARALGQPTRLVHASTERELEAAFEALAAAGADALVIGTDTFFNSQGERLARLALRHALPAIYQYREFVAAGGLMSYSGSITDAYRLAGAYTGRILKGEKPSGLPVQRATKPELYVNLRTAAALGLAVPSSLLAFADEVID
jgi:putative tryptophan/tyrosine transport system substrate-binding protein